MSSKGPEYEQTQKLVNIAMKSGMTQDEIAKLCRVDQSTISRWKRNERRARLHQVTPLLQRFGERMERPPFQLYRRTNTPDSGTSVSQFLKVDGRLLLREAYDNTQDREPRSIDRAIRVSVQEVSRGRFALVLERASGAMPKKREKSGAIDLRSRDMPWHLPETGNAFLLNQEELLSWIISLPESIAQQWQDSFFGIERLGLLTTLALLKHGYKVDGLQTLTDEVSGADSA
ncbi:hypothetical protein B6V76_00430 [Thioclava sp. IC9]|nr:hypothetical protein B6V76_00430 [Thioclava sp. IC9]